MIITVYNEKNIEMILRSSSSFKNNKMTLNRPFNLFNVFLQLRDKGVGLYKLTNSMILGS